MSSPDPHCYPFDPSIYREGDLDYKIVRWENKPFVKDSAYCCYYVPIGFDRAIDRAIEKIKTIPGAILPRDKIMIMADHISPWKTNVFMSVAEDHTGEDIAVEKLSGVFLAKVYEGPYSKMGTWIKDVEGMIPGVRESLDQGESAEGSNPLEMYFEYPTCPKCAKEFGKNYVVIFAKLAGK